MAVLSVVLTILSSHVKTSQERIDAAMSRISVVDMVYGRQGEQLEQWVYPDVDVIKPVLESKI